MGITSGKYNNQRVPKPLVIAKAIGKGKTNTHRVDVLVYLKSIVNLLEMLLVVRAMDMVTPYLVRKKSYLLTSKRIRILGSKLSRNCIQQSFNKELRPALALTVVSKVISLRLVRRKNLPDY